MGMMTFASRNTKEIIRDKINLAFGIGFPVVLILLLTAIQSNIPVDLFKLDNLTPGIAVFGLTFISLFSGTLIAKDRSSSFLMRLYSTPLRPSDYIFGYTLPLLPLSIVQIVICFTVAALLGLSLSLNYLMAVVSLIPTALMFIGFGLLTGSIFNDKQVGAICGAILTNLCGWLSGTWFSLELVGGWFKKIAYMLPFAHATDLCRAALNSDYCGMLSHLWWVLGYAAVILAAAILVFRRKMSYGK